MELYSTRPSASKYTPLAALRFFSGLMTQRSPFAGIDSRYSIRFLGVRQDALLSGGDCEISNRLTLVRRPGQTAYGVSNLVSPHVFYAWQLAAPPALLLVVDDAGGVYRYSPTYLGEYFAHATTASQSNFLGVVDTLYVANPAFHYKIPGVNLLGGSNAFSTSLYWTVTGATVSTAGAVTDPYSQTNAWQLTPGTPSTSASLASALYAPNRVPLGLNTFTFSIWLQAAAANSATLKVLDQAAAQGTVNITIPGDNAWHLYQLTVTLPSTSTSVGVSLSNFGNTGLVYVYGAQLEVGGPASATEINNKAGSGVYDWGIVGPTTAPTLTFTQVGSLVTTNTAVKFDGTTAYVTTATSRGVPFQPFTYELLFNTTAMQNGVLIGFEGDQVDFISNRGSRYLWIDSGGHVAFSTYDLQANVWHTLASTTPYNDGNTHHLACVFNQGGTPSPGSNLPILLDLYVDGTLVASTSNFMQGDDLDNFQGWFRMAEGGDNTVPPPSMFSVKSFYSGTLLAPAIYLQKALTAAQISNHSLTFFGTGLAAYYALVLNDGPTYFWKLNETSGTVAAESADSNAGTYQGSVTLAQTITIFQGTWLASHAYALNATIVDSNGNIQKATTAGTSGGTQPTNWAIVAGFTTTDGTVTWTEVGPGGLSPRIGYQYSYAYMDSSTGHVSNASLLSVNTGPLTVTSITVSGYGSGDPQVDAVVIFRNVDGGPFFYRLAQIANPGAGKTWSYQDTTLDSGLNTAIFAPIDLLNSPPPTGSVDPAWHAGRMWLHVNNLVYFSLGSDNTNLLHIAINGVVAESWPPANVIPFDSVVVRKVSTPSGLLVFTQTAIWIIVGTDLSNFQALKLFERVGIVSWNALTVDGSSLYIYTADRQLLALSPSSGVLEVGFAIGDLLQANIDPTTVYLTRHIAGSTDNALYVSNGSTGWYRLNPSMAGEQSPAWSPFATVTGGCLALGSIQTSPGVYQLLMGQASKPVLFRDLTSSTDAGLTYTWSAVIGSLILASPGQLAEVESVTIEANAANGGVKPTLGVLLDEISGAFETLSASVPDPAQLVASTTVLSNRYYLTQGTVPPVCRHIQLKLTGAAAATQDEVLGFTLRGNLTPEQI